MRTERPTTADSFAKRPDKRSESEITSLSDILLGARVVSIHRGNTIYEELTIVGRPFEDSFGLFVRVKHPQHSCVDRISLRDHAVVPYVKDGVATWNQDNWLEKRDSRLILPKKPNKVRGQVFGVSHIRLDSKFDLCIYGIKVGSVTFATKPIRNKDGVVEAYIVRELEAPTDKGWSNPSFGKNVYLASLADLGLLPYPTGEWNWTASLRKPRKTR